MSRKISSFFITRGIISEDDMDVYAYSFEILISTLQSFLTLAALAFISRTSLETVLFLLGFIPLRMVAGGYHAKNHFRCFLILLFTYMVFLILMYVIPTGAIIPTIISCCSLSVLLVFFLAPSEDENKPLTPEETILFKKKSTIAIVCYAAVNSIFAVFSAHKRFAFALSLGVLTVALSLFANHIKCKKRQIPNKVTLHGDVKMGSE